MLKVWVIWHNGEWQELSPWFLTPSIHKVLSRQRPIMPPNILFLHCSKVWTCWAAAVLTFLQRNHWTDSQRHWLPSARSARLQTRRQREKKDNVPRLLVTFSCVGCFAMMLWMSQSSWKEAQRDRDGQTQFPVCANTRISNWLQLTSKGKLGVQH